MEINMYLQFAYWCWLALFVVWLLGYFNIKRNIARPNLEKYFGTTLLIVLGFLMVFTTNASGFFGMQLTPQNANFGVIGIVIVVIGVLFAIWARFALGSNWSGHIATVKENHELIQSGPYALVRHPIYTGFFFGMIGTALTLGMVINFLGVIVGLTAFLIRVKMEERIMTKEFPNDYPNYKQKVKALIPFVW